MEDIIPIDLVVNFNIMVLSVRVEYQDTFFAISCVNALFKIPSFSGFFVPKPLPIYSFVKVFGNKFLSFHGRHGFSFYFLELTFRREIEPINFFGSDFGGEWQGDRHKGIKGNRNLLTLRTLDLRPILPGQLLRYKRLIPLQIIFPVDITDQLIRSPITPHILNIGLFLHPIQIFV
jgi:hypothetical protein